MTPRNLLILGIDIGSTNFSFSINSVCLTFNEDQKTNASLDVLDVRKINLADYTYPSFHRVVPYEYCRIPHTSLACDRLNHFLQEEHILFHLCDSIIVEKQPPQSYGATIEQLIISKFRNKAYLVQPVSLHKSFLMPRENRDLRKMYSVEIVSKYLWKFPWFHDMISNNDRCHDLTDSVLILLYYFWKHHQLFVDFEHIKEKLNTNLLKTQLLSGEDSIADNNNHH